MCTKSAQKGRFFLCTLLCTLVPVIGLGQMLLVGRLARDVTHRILAAGADNLRNYYLIYRHRRLHILFLFHIILIT